MARRLSCPAACGILLPGSVKVRVLAYRSTHAGQPRNRPVLGPDQESGYKEVAEFLKTEYDFQM